MNIEQARFNMIEQQIRTWDVLDLDVLELLTVVKRENFVPQAYRSLAFVDTEIPILNGGKNGEYMMTPKFEARILQEAAVKKHENVLEIGAGSGYMAALLAHKGRYVTTVELEPALKTMAAKNLAEAGIVNAEVVQGNGANGWPASDASGKDAARQYDVIVISGSLPELPDAFLRQITVGGRILAIIGKAPVMSAVKVTRDSENSYTTIKLFETNVRSLREAVALKRFSF